jgi:ABC-type nickel/cobalt efflux system permease component RcnA
VLGLDEYLASLSDGSPAVLILVVAALLGLRHATDPDHLAAVATLVAGDRETAVRAARRLGLAWGLGHALSLLALGVPIVVFRAFLPGGLVQAAEVGIAILVMYLSLRVVVRWRRGYWHVHVHDHDDAASHLHLHAHEAEDVAHGHEHGQRAPRARTPLGAFAVGVVHGIGGSAGVGLLLLASIDTLAIGIGALVFFAGFTAVSMTFISGGVGRVLAGTSRRGATPVLPAVAVVTFAFGAYYGMSALGPLSRLL